jgi:hypothetical protein
MKLQHGLILAVLIGANATWSGKQRIIVRLREPLRAETIKIRVPELSNGKGETRDLETQLQLGGPQRTEAPKLEQNNFKLNMVLRSVGKNAVQVTLTLPTPGYVQLMLLDFYGKNQGALLDGNMPAGIVSLPPIALKETDHNGISFLTLKINDKVVMKKVITKVR